MPEKTRKFVCATLAALLSPAALLADEGSDPDSLDSLTLELMNPVGRLSYIDNRFDYRSYQGDLPGADDQSNSRYEFSPVIPFGLSNGRRLLLRFTIPVSFSTPAYDDFGQEHAEWLIRQRADILTDDGFFLEGHGHLDNISYGLAYGDTEDSGLFWMVGLAGVLPTSKDGSIERDQYLLGPDLAIGKTYDWGMLGIRAKHLVDVGDVERNNFPVIWDTNESRINLIFAYGLRNGWHIVSNPEIVYDWEGADDNQLLLPLGGGVAKTFRWGSVPLKASLEAYTYVQSPDAFGPDWQVTFNLAPVLNFLSLD